MRLVYKLFQRFGLGLCVTFLLGLANASLSVVVLAFINDRMIHGTTTSGMSEQVPLQFGALLLALFVIGSVSQLGLTTLGHRLVYELRRSLVKRILDTDIERLETLGPARILACLNVDIGYITSACIALPAAIYGLILCLGGLGYLAWLSQPLFVATSLWLAVTVLGGWILLRKTHARVQAARETEDRLLEDYESVIEGRKELGLNRERARWIYEREFEPHARQGRDHDIFADVYNGVNENWANAMILAAIGLSLYLAEAQGLANAETGMTYALAILFLRTPITSVVTAIPSLVAGSVALAKIGSLDLPEYRPDFGASERSLRHDWQTVRLESIEYRYPDKEAGGGFAIGPIDLTLRRGETVFLIGGNGSGKSTLARLVTGLYRPCSGRIVVDGLAVDDACQPAFRALFATVFSDYYLFRQLLGEAGEPSPSSTVLYWLRRLALGQKVKVEQWRLMDTDFSQGQRKRLALLLALLEDRPILVLDECAADQDPSFRRTFYTDLLPGLKAAGKTLVVITHDEHYFHLADRLFKMDEGRLSETEAVAEAFEANVAAGAPLRGVVPPSAQPLPQGIGC
jgi:putative ATP-binding cassette transporter